MLLRAVISRIGMVIIIVAGRMPRTGTAAMIRGRMNVRARRVTVTTPSIQPDAVMKPWIGAGAVINTFASAHITAVSDAATEPDREQQQRPEKKFADDFHGRVAGLALSTYSTSPITPPVESATMANRLS